jgi:hypothetical protein
VSSRPTSPKLRIVPVSRCANRPRASASVIGSLNGRPSMLVSSCRFKGASSAKKIKRRNVCPRGLRSLGCLGLAALQRELGPNRLPLPGVLSPPIRPCMKPAVCLLPQTGGAELAGRRAVNLAERLKELGQLIRSDAIGDLAAQRDPVLRTVDRYLAQLTTAPASRQRPAARAMIRCPAPHDRQPRARLPSRAS